jgi:hypothetical protein
MLFMSKSCEQLFLTQKCVVFKNITSSCSKYSSSASTIEKTRLFLFRMLSACGDLMYSSTICFHRRRHSHPRKKLWTFLIFRNSIESCTESHKLTRFDDSGKLPVVSGCCSFDAPALKLPRPTGVAENDERFVSLRNTQIYIGSIMYNYVWNVQNFITEK